MINQIEAENVIDLLILLQKSELEGSELEIILMKTFFQNFRRVKQLHEDLEKLVYDQKGLMIKLFEHTAGKSKSITRKVTFLDN